jgi:hypothetical protein
MADFAAITESGVIPVYINVDYVVRIERGVDPREPTTVRFRDRRSISLSRSEGDKLVAQLNLCCNERKKGIKRRRTATA